MLRLALLLISNLASFCGASFCSSGRRVECTTVQSTAGVHPTLGDGYHAQGSVRCTPDGRKVYCLVHHDDHQCPAGQTPCCEDGSKPTTGSNSSTNASTENITCTPVAAAATTPLEDPTAAAARMAPSVQVVLDDMDHPHRIATTNTFEGNFQPCLKDAFKQQFHHDCGKNKGNAYFTFGFNLSESGCYKIEEYHPGSDIVCAKYLPRNARLDVDFCKGLTTTFSINQAQHGAQWNEVGSLMFYEGYEGRITMRNSPDEQCSADDCFMVVDAFRLTRTGDHCAPKSATPKVPNADVSNAPNTNASEASDTDASKARSTDASKATGSERDGVLHLSASSHDGSGGDLSQELLAHSKVFEEVLMAHFDFHEVEVLRVVAVEGRRLRDFGAKQFHVHFHVQGEAVGVMPDGGSLVVALQEAFDAAGADVIVESALVKWVDLGVPMTGVKDDPFPLLAVALAILVVGLVVVLAGCIVCMIRRAPRDSDVAKTTVVQVAPSKNEDADEYPAKDDCEIASTSTGTPKGDAWGECSSEGSSPVASALRLS